MERRLVKIAKELNVGTTTIVEHLLKSGYEIENKPTAKVTEEMYNHLLQEFQGSVAIKEKADQLIIGTRPQIKKETPPPPPPIPEKKTPPPTPEVKAKEEPAPVNKEQQTPVEKSVEAPKEKVTEEKKEVVEEAAKPKLKIVGKIDLDKPKKTKAKEEPQKKEEAKEEPVEAKEEEVVVEEEAVEATPEAEAEVVEEVDSAAADSDEDVDSEEEDEEYEGDETVRAEAPELRGLKIQGKIDLDKFQKPKKKKKPKEKAAGNAASDKPATGKDAKKAKTAESNSEDAQNRKKRKRTRRKISTTQQQSGGGNRRRDNRSNRSQREEVKEVSQKEIEEKIKATMARLSGGGKKKRQKMRRDNRERLREKQEQIEQERQTDKLQITEFVSVTELASLMDVPVTEVITTCMNLGVIVSINQRLDAEIIELLAEEFNHEVEFISVEEQADEDFEIEDDEEDLMPRAPIVTVMGHVDHGKTSLLDYIRKTNVAGGEAGGITQHIGAYEVKVGEDNKKITFLDTPGHEAFTAMRARGAKVTDIAIIIIAADDSIMPQTKEAISHAQAAGVPMVFAINKIDKDGAQPDKIKQELASMNLLIEEWGGSHQSQDISAKTGLNIDLLLEKILLEAEILELKANPDRKAVGTVIEASLDKGRGYVTKILVQTGTLKIGDPLVAAEYSGKIKAMFNERGKRIKQAGPSSPVLILGLSGAPQAGERFKVVDSEQEARQIASKRGQISREQTNRATKRISLDEIGRRLALGTFKELNLIVKGDVDGSIEALSDSLIKLSIETVQVNVIHKAVGQIIESDVLLASASDAIIIGFQVRPSLGARKLAEKEGVEIKLYSIIYEAIEEIKMAIEGMLEPTKEERITAQVDVREVYKISRVGTIAGCYVQDGIIRRNSFVRLIRNGIVVYPTKEGAVAEIASLKRFKDDVKEVKAGLECGISLKNFNDIKVGDVIEAYEIVEVKQRLK